MARSLKLAPEVSGSFPLRERSSSGMRMHVWYLRSLEPFDDVDAVSSTQIYLLVPFSAVA